MKGWRTFPFLVQFGDVGTSGALDPRFRPSLGEAVAAHDRLVRVVLVRAVDGIVAGTLCAGCDCALAGTAPCVSKVAANTVRRLICRSPAVNIRRQPVRFECGR